MLAEGQQDLDCNSKVTLRRAFISGRLQAVALYHKVLSMREHVQGGKETPRAIHEGMTSC